MTERKTQWHPAFCAAMKLELIEDSECLDYESEHTLNTKPLQIDLLIVKKIKDVEIKNELGKIFRKHNLMEYKSPKDAMNENTYLKVVAYACLYKTYEEHVGDIELEEITITLVRESKPEKLFQWFVENGYEIKQVYQGIYYTIREHSFPTQIVVSKELSKENQKWLTALSSSLDRKDAKRIAKQMDLLNSENKKELGDSVLQVAVKENRNIFYSVKEDEYMAYPGIRELFAPEIREAEQKAERRGMQNVILGALRNGSGAVEIARVLGIPLEQVEAVEKEAMQVL